MSQSELHQTRKFFENANAAQSLWALVQELGARVFRLHNSKGVAELGAALVKTRESVFALTAANADSIHATSQSTSKPDNVIPFPTKKESPSSVSEAQQAP